MLSKRTQYLLECEAARRGIRPDDLADQLLFDALMRCKPETLGASIYGIIDPTTRKYVYVGRTRKSLRFRLSQHIAKAPNKKMQAWIDDLTQRGVQPVIRLLEDVRPAEMEAREYYWILAVSAHGYNLFNSIDPTTVSLGRTKFKSRFEAPPDPA